MSNLPNKEAIPPAKVLQDLLVSRSKSIAAVAAKGLDAQRVIKIVLGAAMRNPTLLQCEPNSVLRSVIQSVELGLEPGGALGEAHLVPFWNNKKTCYECQLIIDYKGIAALMYRSGLIDFITAEVVYEGDEFEYELGLDPKLRHVPMDETIDPKAITHAYMVVGIKGGARSFRVMTRRAIERIRNEFSATGKDTAKYGPKGPWVDHYAEMAKKTVLKGGSKLLPKSIEVARLVQFDDAAETGDWSAIDFDSPDALPENAEAVGSTTTSQVSKTSDAIKKAVIVTSQTFAEQIGMDERQEQEFRTACQSDDIDPDKVISQAQLSGVQTVEALYSLLRELVMAE